VLVLGYLRSACSLACFQDDLSSLDQPLRARGASYHVLKNVELQGTDLDWGSLRIWHRMLLLRIAFSLILSYPPLLRYFREAVLDAYISSKRSVKEKDIRSLYGEGPLEILSSYADQRVLLRAILEHIDEKEVVTLDLTDLVAGGWLDEHDFDSAFRKGLEFDMGVPIIITEGTYDAQVLKGAIEILKPHLAPYIRFLDYDFRNEGSASVAVSTLKSFAAAGISNRIVAIFDNDSAAREAVTALKGIKLPPQYKVIHYPDINLANEYPTLGPQGNVTMNVNGLAGSIELYLGADVLKDNEGNLMPVQWKGYMSKIKSYQGELLYKSLAQKAFNEKLKAAKTNRKNVDKQDWSGLSAILDKLVETLSNL